MAKPVLDMLVPKGVSSVDVAALRELLIGIVPGGMSYNMETPVIAPAMLLGAEGLGALVHKMQPPIGMGVVHEGQKIRRKRRLPLDTALGLNGAVEGVGATQVFSFTLTGGEENIGCMETRLRFVTPDIMRTLKGARFREAMNTPDIVWFETKAVSLQSVERYLALSHDPNPIHRDENAARAIGLKGAVVPGMMIAGLCEVALSSVAFPISELRARYMAPLFIEERLHFGVQVKSARRARIFAVTDENLIVAIFDADSES